MQAESLTGTPRAPRTRPSWTVRSGRWLRHAARGRDVLVCAALTVLTLLQSPGLIVADTKIDMAVNPVGFLSRALHMWDPTGSFGQVQNQAYGYFWPMGPFFAVGTGIGLPPWVVQRLWWALLLCLAYTGVVRLAERLGIGTPASRLVAGLAFAFSPRIMTELGGLSIEAWPSAIAPWVIIPLIGIATGRSIRRAVALSALAVACAGGVNATAVLAVLPLPFLWLLTLRPLRRRMITLVAWCAAVVAATAWWVLPLLVFGRYSPPFVHYVETATTTTGVTDPITVLRGANYWVAWLRNAFQAEMPAGWEIANRKVLVAATVAVAALGVAGLARRGMPHRRFLITGLVLGFGLVGMGHLGQLPGTPAVWVRELLDGIALPLRNVHKFDVLIRLPLMLGIAHVLGLVLRWQSIRDATARLRRRPRLGIVASAGTMLLIAVAAYPAFLGNLAAPRGFTAVPGYWRDAATWLNERTDDGRVLVVPGANFPHYTWGDTLDEIIQPLLTVPASVRNVIPMSPAGTIRMMDAVETALATGEGSSGLADYLARAGVSYLLVRNDLNYGQSATAAPLVTQQALRRSPGFEEVASFGPDTGPTTVDGARDPLGVAVPALQVLRVDQVVDRVVAYPAAQVPTVTGGPESLLWLAEAGLLPAGPTILAGDLATLVGTGSTALGTGPVLVTDGLRLRDVSFGSGKDPASTTLTAAEGRNAHDYLPDWGAQWTTSAAYLGVAEIGASSAWSNKNPAGVSRPEHLPFAAFDGDATTSWQAEPGTVPAGQWLEVTLNQPQAVPQVSVVFDPSAGGLPTRVTVDTGVERVTVDVTGSTVTVPLSHSQQVTRVRLTVDNFVENVKNGNVGVTELTIPGVTAQRTLLVRAPAAGSAPATVVLTADDATPACFTGPVLDTPVEGVHCFAEVARPSEDGLTIDRTLTLVTPSAYQASVWARPRPGAALNELLDSLVGAGTSVTASSSSFAEPTARPGAVTDGDPGTTWWAAADDPTPELHFTWSTPQRLTGLRLSLTDDATGSPVTQVTIVAGGTEFTRPVTAGEVRFDAPITTADLTVRLASGTPAQAYNTYRNKLQQLPVAVSEVTFLGDTPQQPRAAVDPTAPLNLACGSGPTLVVDGQTVATRLTATVQDLLELRAVPAVACQEPATSSAGAISTLDAGSVRVVASASDLAVPSRVALVPSSTQANATAQVPVHIDSWSGTRRLVTVEPHTGDLILNVRENTNPGWVARIGGVELAPVIVDGWQQGWVVPAGVSGQIELVFAPDTSYRLGLAAGAVPLLLLLVLAVLPPRRRPPGVADAVDAAALSPTTGARVGILVPLVIGTAGLVLVGGLLGGIIATALVAVIALRTRGTARWRSVAFHRGPVWARLHPWVRHANWLLPSGLLLLGGAGWLYVWMPFRDWIPQFLGILAVGALWLPAVATTRGMGRTRHRPGRS